ncbi:hypothetical protein [Streptomyces flavofungini]|uniref:hypothetical protein n=1 Tax=Streptomyces flavofungini TaxID=68200 RepID=UPI0025B115BE|nr:hypothetical protein [Streptomyces flavofungini]WJV46662.1 hypothetical protein QUY26_14705 [Streptomyces flavofungini]
MPNEILRHPRLSSDAVRLLTWQLSLPDGAYETLSATARSAGIGRTGFNRAKAQLKAEGYLHEWREQRERGRWATRQLISNVPLDAEQAAALRGPAPSAELPTVGQPTGRAVGRHPDATPPENTPQPPPPAVDLPQADQTVADRIIQGLPDLDPRLRVPRGMLAQLAALAVQWLALGHSPDDVRDEIRRGLPGRHQVIHRPGGLVRSLLRDPAPPRREQQPQVAALRECAGPHGSPTLFRPVAGEDRCGECRRERAEAGRADAGGGWAGAGAAARGAPGVRAALRAGRSAVTP